MQLKLTPYILIIIFLHCGLAIKISQELQQVCPFDFELQASLERSKKSFAETQELNRLSEMLFKKESSQSTSKVTFSNEVPLMNLQNFTNSLLGKVQNSGQGAFGKVVYFPNYLMSKYDQSSKNVAVKIQKISVKDNDRHTNILQRNMVVEITFNLALNKIDEMSWYFPKFHLCVNASDTFKKMQQLQNLNQIQRQQFIYSYNQNIFLIFMEPMTIEFFKFFDVVSSENIELSLVARMEMSILLLEGLQKMNSVGYHCDIKPENIMIQKISGIEYRLATENQVQPFEIQNNYYLIKFIDFGLSVFHQQNQKTVCKGGTPGYASTDRILKFDHDKVDLYALGLTLLDMEFALYNLHDIGSIFMIYFKKLANKKMLFTSLEIKELKNYAVVNAFLKYMDENHEMFLTYLESFIPNLREKFSQRFSDKDINIWKPSNYYFTDLSYMLQMTKASIMMFFINIAPTLNFHKSYYKNQIEIQKLTLEISKAADVTKKNRLEYLQKKNELMEIESANQNAFQIELLHLIFPYDKRPSTEEALENIKLIYQKFEEENQDLILDIEMEEVPVSDEKIFGVDQLINIPANETRKMKQNFSKLEDLIENDRLLI